MHSRRESAWRVCAFLAGLGMVLVLSACATTPPPPPPPPPPGLPAIVEVAPGPPPRVEQEAYFRLRSTTTQDTPVRVAILLPYASNSAETRAVARALEHAAELALFDSGNANILLMPRDVGNSPEQAAAAAAAAIAEGAEVILGPLFAQSVAAVGPVAQEWGVPVIAFSTDRTSGGNGVYLLSFQPEAEVERIVSYAARSGHTTFAALVPQSAYGEIVATSFRETVLGVGGAVTAVQTVAPETSLVAGPAAQIAASRPDAILIGEGGIMLRALAPALALNGAVSPRVKLLGTGLWDNPTVAREPMLINGWFAAPNPDPWRAFSARYQAAYDSAPPRTATLAYDAMSLVALLADGVPYRRYTDQALTDPNGFAGVDGIFRFREDGSADRGLAVLQVGATGFAIVDPAPRSFQVPGF